MAGQPASAGKALKQARDIATGLQVRTSSELHKVIASLEKKLDGSPSLEAKETLAEISEARTDPEADTLLIACPTPPSSDET